MRHTLIKYLNARVGMASTAVFVIGGKKRYEDVWMAIHGDDIAAVCPVHILKKFLATLRNKLQPKANMLGEGDGCVSEVSLLNRKIRLETTGTSMEADENTWRTSCALQKVRGPSTGPFRWTTL